MDGSFSSSSEMVSHFNLLTCHLKSNLPPYQQSETLKTCIHYVLKIVPPFNYVFICVFVCF